MCHNYEARLPHTSIDGCYMLRLAIARNMFTQGAPDVGRPVVGRPGVQNSAERMPEQKVSKSPDQGRPDQNFSRKPGWKYLIATGLMRESVIKET